MNKRAVSLAEVIIAALILSITVGGLLYIFTSEKAVILRTGRKVQAMDFARQQLEGFKNAVEANTWEIGGVLAETDTDWSGDQPGDWTAWQPLSGDFGDVNRFAGQRRYRVKNIDADSDGNTDYKQVQVAIDWQEP